MKALGERKGLSRAISEILIIGVVVTAIAGISGYYSLMSQVGMQSVSLQLADYQLSKVNETAVLVSVTLKNDGTVPVVLNTVKFDGDALFYPGVELNPGSTWSNATVYDTGERVGYGDVHTLFVEFEADGSNLTKAFTVRVSF
ncbi:TPA: hypothetical protein EYP38_01140 [Candidatus Micrarchaeota archaeon]|nr:hypothetical protein [Candidatus Micrarchaeota archaeon]